MTIEKLNKKVGYERGTTLVEAIVVVFILSFGLIPSFFTVISANNLATSIKNNLVAANLAQEGFEGVWAVSFFFFFFFYSLFFFSPFFFFPLLRYIISVLLYKENILENA